MAARAIVPLISLDKMEEYLDKLMHEIKTLSQEKEQINQNYIHGCLLQFKFLSERCFGLAKKDIDMKPLFERFLAIKIYCLDKSISFLIKSLYIDILSLLFKNKYTGKSSDST